MKGDVEALSFCGAWQRMPLIQALMQQLLTGKRRVNLDQKMEVFA